MYRHLLIFLVLFSVILLLNCQNDGKDKSKNITHVNNSETRLYNGPGIEFDTTSVNFGRVYEGEMVGWYFKYKNTGDQNLIIVNVSADCGCTLPEYKKEPLKPGSSGEIKVVFDTRGRTGHQFKTIKVESNGRPEIVELVILAEVIKK
jgi:hypothetical protein